MDAPTTSSPVSTPDLAARASAVDVLLRLSLYPKLGDAVIRRYERLGGDVADLREVARLAAASAAESFDPDAGVDFVTHALPIIRAAVRQRFRAAGGKIGEPPHRLVVPVVHDPDPGTPWP